ncbi:unknown [Bacteroides sp. CAG:144]|nr:unknown [Bacteroides sp. CAG:144]
MIFGSCGQSYIGISPSIAYRVDRNGRQSVVGLIVERIFHFRRFVHTGFGQDHRSYFHTGHAFGRELDVVVIGILATSVGQFTFVTGSFFLLFYDNRVEAGTQEGSHEENRLFASVINICFVVTGLARCRIGISSLVGRMLYGHDTKRTGVLGTGSVVGGQREGKRFVITVFELTEIPQHFIICRNDIGREVQIAGEGNGAGQVGIAVAPARESIQPVVEIDAKRDFITHKIDSFLGLYFQRSGGRTAYSNIYSRFGGESIEIPATVADVSRISLDVFAERIHFVLFQKREILVCSVIEIVPCQFGRSHRIIVGSIGFQPCIIAGFLIFAITSQPVIIPFDHIIGGINHTIITGHDSRFFRSGSHRIFIGPVGIKEHIVIDIENRRHSHIITDIDNIVRGSRTYHHGIILKRQSTVATTILIVDIIYIKNIFQVRKVIERIVLENYFDRYLSEIDRRPSII